MVFSFEFQIQILPSITINRKKNCQTPMQDLMCTTARVPLRMYHPGWIDCLDKILQLRTLMLSAHASWPATPQPSSTIAAAPTTTAPMAAAPTARGWGRCGPLTFAHAATSHDLYIHVTQLSCLPPWLNLLDTRHKYWGWCSATYIRQWNPLVLLYHVVH